MYRGDIFAKELLIKSRQNVQLFEKIFDNILGTHLLSTHHFLK